MSAPTKVLADIDHDHGPNSRWVNKGDSCPVCSERMRGNRDALRARINAYSRAIRRAQIEVGLSMEPGETGKNEAQLYLRALRDGRREVQRSLAAYDLLVERLNETIRGGR